MHGCVFRQAGNESERADDMCRQSRDMVIRMREGAAELHALAEVTRRSMLDWYNRINLWLGSRLSEDGDECECTVWRDGQRRCELWLAGGVSRLRLFKSWEMRCDEPVPSDPGAYFRRALELREQSRQGMNQNDDRR